MSAKKMCWFIQIFVVMLMALMPFGGHITPGLAATPGPNYLSVPESMITPITLRYDPTPSDYHVPPPAQYYAQQARMGRMGASTVKSATITVNYLTSGSVFDNICEPWPSDAITSFEYAKGIWESLLQSTVRIEIDACWTSIADSNVLGQGGASILFNNATQTYYPAALANTLAGSDINGDASEIKVAYNKNFSWHYDPNTVPTGGMMDFASVVLHEICHGLGFSGSMAVGRMSSTGPLIGAWGYGDPNNPYPAIYDRFVINGGGTAILNFPNFSESLYQQLTSNSLYFNAPLANVANGGTAPKLFAPSTWMQGSSYAHLDYETYNDTPNALMVYAISANEALHDPGPIVLAMLQDIGWTLAQADPAPTVSSISPNRGNNYGTTTITNLAGSNFQAGATVKLIRSGQTDIVATHVNIVSAEQITCEFDLTGAAAGAWDVVVTNPDNQQATLSGGFTVQALPAPQIMSVTPVSATNAGDTTSLTVKGSDFWVEGHTSVKLTRAGQSDLIAFNVSVVSKTQLTGEVDLLGASPGQWDLVVTNPDGQVGTLPNAVAVEASLTAPTLAGVTPSEGGNTQTVQITLRGTNFITTGTTLVRLTRDGKHLQADSVNVLSPTQIMGAVNLNDADGGLWDVIVTNPNGESAVLREVFKVNVEVSDIYLPWVARGYRATLPVSLVNGDFERGPGVGWTEYSAQGWRLILDDLSPTSFTAHTGNWATWLGGDDDELAYIEQTVTILASAPYLSYWHIVDSAETVCGNDVAKIVLGTTEAHVYNLCKSQNTSGWVKYSVDLSAYAGQTVNLRLSVQTNASDGSNLFVDDVAFQATP